MHRYDHAEQRIPCADHPGLRRIASHSRARQRIKPGRVDQCDHAVLRLRLFAEWQLPVHCHHSIVLADAHALGLCHARETVNGISRRSGYPNRIF